MSEAGVGELEVGEGVLFCSLLMEDRLSDLKKEEETRSALPVWEHRCCDQQACLGLVQA